MTTKGKTAKKAPRKRGRKKIEITPQMLERARELASKGLRKADIARLLGMSHETFNNRQNEMPELAEAIELGRIEGVEFAVTALHRNVEAGDTASIKYFLNNRTEGHWRDKVDYTIAGDPKNPLQHIVRGRELSEQDAKEMYQKMMQGDED